jgi:Zn-dependent peptidase ImmA (M78 family)
MNNSLTDTTNGDSPQSGVALLFELRRLMPLRPISYSEHLKLAELQATRLRALLKQYQPDASLAWLTAGTLISVQVVLQGRWKMEGISGLSTWSDDHWVIGINKGDSHARRRFTLCHELKHVIDASRDRITYRGITEAQRERIAQYFAACYLMPKLLVRRAWTSGIQDPEALAGLFKVSREAMLNRLIYLQYLDDQPERPVASYFRISSDWLPAATLAAPAHEAA